MTGRLRWRGQRKPLDPRLVSSVEDHFGVTLPHDYRECLVRNHGASPVISDFEVAPPGEASFTSGIGVLLSADPDDPENIINTHRGMGRYADRRLVPIADDGGGDFVCLDYRSGQPPRIVYFRSELGQAVALAADFTALCNMLHEPE